jgi:hypothetical protein
MVMTDQETPYDDQEIDAGAEGSGEDPDRRSLIVVLAVAVTIIVIVLVLLMLRGCDSVLNSANRRSSTNQIVPVAGQPPVDGSVSIWVAAGTDLETVLSEAGVNRTGVVDMGGGRFVVEVPPGTEVEVMRRLRDVSAVYDAGRVYADETTP